MNKTPLILNILGATFILISIPIIFIFGIAVFLSGGCFDVLIMTLGCYSSIFVSFSGAVIYFLVGLSLIFRWKTAWLLIILTLYFGVTFFISFKIGSLGFFLIHLLSLVMLYKYREMYGLQSNNA